MAPPTGVPFAGTTTCWSTPTVVECCPAAPATVTEPFFTWISEPFPTALMPKIGSSWNACTVSFVLWTKKIALSCVFWSCPCSTWHDVAP